MSNKAGYVAQLPSHMQAAIKEALVSQGVAGEDLENALDSKVSDLADTIDLEKIFSM